VALHYGNNNSNNRGTPKPLYVMNITDVDDKIIQRSREMAKQQLLDNRQSFEQRANPIALARRYEREFWQDMDQLNVLRPDVVCRVSEHVNSTIVPYIQQIVDGGLAYVINEDESQSQRFGSVYFDVRAFEERAGGLTKYGKLAPDAASSDFFSWDGDSNGNNNSDDDDQDEPSHRRKKRDPRDFALWKYRSRKQSNSTHIIEPESVSYQSPWGPGRPGWHVECSAMIERLSRDFSKSHRFLVHAGGVDLKFPHHSNEIAQAEAFALAANDGNATNTAGNTIHHRDGARKEWIPHWMHTGHLYVKGRKMSKSLKNFITIREMLDESEVLNEDGAQTTTTTTPVDNEWSSPADDFRLWCLGLSGSYRGPATYSKDRMEEARVIRIKWVRFLMEGQRWFDDLQSSSCNELQSTRFWRPMDIELFQTATDCRIKCHNALVGRASIDGEKGSFDLDGAVFVKELTNIAENGLRYLDIAKADSKSCPGEPLLFTISTVRELLALVGFTNKTYNAGLQNNTFGQFGSESSGAAKERVLIDEIVAFRSAIRSSAINGMKNKDGLSAVKEVLRLCDELRDGIMPSHGVEILDGKSGEDTGGGWRSCSPRDNLNKKS
jgi:cysteinyl-tRNA synthetase